MKEYKIIKACVIDGESRQPAKGKKGLVELDAKTARPLIKSGKIEDPKAKDEKLELTLNIDPKELEAVKDELAAKDAEIEEIKAEHAKELTGLKNEVHAKGEAITQLIEEIETLKAQLEEGAAALEAKDAEIEEIKAEHAKEIKALKAAHTKELKAAKE